MAMNIDASVNISADVSGQSAVERLSQALKNMGNQGEMSAKQTANAMRMVPAQLTDIATQLAGGQSPFLIMMQQGGQLRDMFGSVTGALAGVGRTLIGMLNPWTAAAAVIGTIAYAAYRGSQEFYELSNRLTLTGNAAGYTAGQIEKMARALSDTTGVSAGKGRDIMGGLAGSGAFWGENLKLAAEAAARVQKLSGQTSEEVTKDFANMAKGVASWAAEHNRQFNFLSFAQFQHIKNLEEMGNKEAAMRETMKALNEGFKGRVEQLGTIERLWRGIKTGAEDAWKAMLNIGKPETNEDRLDRVRKALEANARRTDRADSMGPNGLREGADRQRQRLLEELRNTQRAIDLAEGEQTRRAEEAAKTRARIEASQSGQLDALATARLMRRLEEAKGAAQKEIDILEESGQRIENQYRAGLMTEQQYNAEKLRIAKAVLNERMKLAEKEIELEGTRPAKSPAEIEQNKAKVQALRNQLAQLNSQVTMAGLKAEGDDAAFGRKMREEVEKFSRNQQARVDQILGEANATGMSTLEYRKHTEALRIDKEAADAMVGKSPEYVEAIRAEAEAKKKATAAALDYADAKARSFDTGVKAAMKEYIETTANAANQAKNLFTNAFKGMEDALVNFVKTGKVDFKSLADSIISDMVRIMIQQRIMGPLMNGLNSFLFGPSGGGTAVNGSAGTANMSMFAADGAAFGMGGVKAFANGGAFTNGIYNSPTLFTFAGGGKFGVMGEAGPEAVMPLKRGRDGKLGVAGGGGSNVVVNVVNNATGTKAEAQERQDSNGTRIIDVVIEQVKASIAADISRGTGTVTSALERTYGASRAAGAY